MTFRGLGILHKRSSGVVLSSTKIFHVDMDLTKGLSQKVFTIIGEKFVFIILKREGEIYKYNLKVQIVLCDRCCYNFIFFILTHNSFWQKSITLIAVLCDGKLKYICCWNKKYILFLQRGQSFCWSWSLCSLTKMENRI